MRRVRRVIAVAGAVVALSGCGGEDTGGVVGPDSTEPANALEVGKDVYSANCATCHGKSGGGGLGPKLADGRVVDQYPDPADHRKVVVEGRGQMPAWGERLSDEEIDAVVQYEREGLG